jgi:hypothetical protein
VRGGYCEGGNLFKTSKLHQTKYAASAIPSATLISWMISSVRLIAKIRIRPYSADRRDARASFDNFVGAGEQRRSSTLLQEDHTEYHALAAAYLFWSADVSATIGCDHVVNRFIGDRHPFTVNFDLVVVANHATLGWATIHQVAARALAVISF